MIPADLDQLIRRTMHVNWALADQVVVSGVNFSTGLLLARGLGLSEFGVFSLAWVVVLFVYSLQFAGVSAPMMSIAQKIELADKPAYFGSVVLHHLVFCVLSAILIWVGVILSGHFFPDAGVDHFALSLAAVTVAYQTRDFLRRHFYAANRHRAAFFLNAVGYGGQLAILIVLFFTEKLTIQSALWSITAISAVASFGAYLCVEKLRFSMQGFVAVARRHWRFSRWLGASVLLDFFANQFLLVMSGAFLGPAAAGAMKAAQNLMGIAQLIFFALENIVPVRAGWHFHHGGVDALAPFIKRAAIGCITVTALIALIFCTEPEFWLHLIFGDQFVGYGLLVQLYGVAFLLKAGGFAFGAGLYALEDTRPIFLAYCLATSIAAAATYPLLVNFGVTGAVIGAVIVEIVMVSIIGAGFVVRVRRLQRNDAVVAADI